MKIQEITRHEAVFILSGYYDQKEYLEEQLKKYKEEETQYLFKQYLKKVKENIKKWRKILK